MDLVGRACSLVNNFSSVAQYACGAALSAYQNIRKLPDLPKQWNSCPTKLAESEERLFHSVGVRVKAKMIPVRFKLSEIYTITVECTGQKLSEEPIVLIHGQCAGVAVWAANIAELSKSYTVHAFDLLGFGRSSRPRFSSDSTLAELEMVGAIEDWRRVMGIESMHVIAHAFGAYLASSYALEHPSRVKHLVLVDPWGFSERVFATNKQFNIRWYMRVFTNIASSSYVNPLPLTGIRIAGPYAPLMLWYICPDLREKFWSFVREDIYLYIYHCNAQSPTGEQGFINMSKGGGWAKRPMVKRFNGIDKSVPVTFIYGSRTFMAPDPAVDIQAQRRNGFVQLKILSGAGHHVYADVPRLFNETVLKALAGSEPSPRNSLSNYSLPVIDEEEEDSDVEVIEDEVF